MQRLSRTAAAYLVAIVLGPLGVLLLRWIGSPWRGRLVFLVLIPPIAIAAYLGSIRPGVLATLVISAAYLISTDWGQLDSRERASVIIAVITFTTIGTLLSWLLAALRSARRRAESEREVRRQAELRVRDEHERLRVTLSSIGDAVIVTDVNGNVTFMNPVAADLTGWDAEEAGGKPLEQVFRIVNEQTRLPAENPVHRVLREKVIVGLANHTVLMNRNGREIPIDDSGAPIRGEDGNIVGVVLVFRDVTEARKAMEARLYLAGIVESSDDAIIGETLNGIITSWNRGAERLYGYRADEVLGKPISIIGPPVDPDELPWIMERIRRGEQIEHLETQRICKDGRCVDVSLVISPIKNAEGRIIGASKIARDITSSKEADRHKNEFLALLAHELRNPLAPLRNGLEILKLAKNDPAAFEATHTMMERQLQQLSRLVDDLLDVNRISRGMIELRTEHVPLAAVVSTAIETCEPLRNQRGHKLTVRLPDRGLNVNADKTRLSQVLANLLSNAVKYTEPGGHIWLTVDHEADDAVIRVKDTGIGIPAPMLPKVFDLFTQVDHSLEKAQGGLGVGLAIVRRLVELHGGRVEAHSDGHGRGSEFVIRLPAVPHEVERPHEDAVRLNAPPVAARRVLVVDDSPDAASSMAMMLKMMGNEVQTGSDGLAAVNLAGQFRPDVILLDIGMPLLNGYDACRRIREQPWGKNMFIVALTGWGQDQDRARSQEAGFDCHLVKPVEPKTLNKLFAERA